MRALLQNLASLALTGATVLRSTSVDASTLDWDAITHVYAFGDSYTFVQGTLGHANFSFVGDFLDLSFTPEELLCDEIMPKNTSSDGSNWIEYLTGCFEGLPSKCNKELWNFAFAGADIDGDLLPLHHNFTTPLVDQVKQYVDYAADAIPHPDGQTLTFWWIGINDTGDTVTNSSITDFEQFWTTEMESYFRAVQLAYDHGLKDHLFINVPPEERSPASLGSSSAEKKKENIVLFNNVLANFTARFSEANPDAFVGSFDAYSWFNDVLDNADAYGFSNITGFCTCTDSSYFWYNTGHPTEHVHRLLATAMEQQLKSS